jgi:hypothetical protein
MPIVPTPPGLEGTVAEDERFQEDMGPGLFYVSGIYDQVADIIKNGLILDGSYRVVGKNVSITRTDIREKTKESAEGKVFCIFNIEDIFLFSMKKIDEDFVIKYAAIIIAGGKRYKVAKRGKQWLEKAESDDFHFIEIGKGDILKIIGQSVAGAEVAV